MILEEPELGSMLCKTFHAMVGQLIHFSESVNKVQTIFKLLRHTESHDAINTAVLQQEYDLPVTCKFEDEEFQNNQNIDQKDGKNQIPLKCFIGRIVAVNKIKNKLYSQPELLLHKKKRIGEYPKRLLNGWSNSNAHGEDS